MTEPIMWRLIHKQGGNWCCRIGLGLALSTVLILLAAKSNRSIDISLAYPRQALAADIQPGLDLQTTEQARLAELERLAREEPLTLIRLSRKNYQRSVRDYICTFTKQELINGHLKEPQTITVCCKEAPFSVLMHWQQSNATVDKLLFVEKDGKGTMLIRLKGLGGLLGTVKRDVNDPRNRQSSLRGPDQFGFSRSLQRIIAVCEKAEQHGDLKIDYLGIEEVDGRPCLVLLRTLPMEKGYPAARLRLFLDREYLLPTRIESYDTGGSLLSVYMFTGVRFNVGLTDELFTPQANGLSG